MLSSAIFGGKFLKIVKLFMLSKNRLCPDGFKRCCKAHNHTSSVSCSLFLESNEAMHVDPTDNAGSCITSKITNFKKLPLTRFCTPLDTFDCRPK